MKRVVGIVQARTSSSRLPGKVLAPILGEPMLRRQLERLSGSRALDALAVATSDQAADDAVAEVADSFGIECVRGSLADVLDRYRTAAGALGADVVVRLTADCPLIDPRIVDRVVEVHADGGYHYTSNFIDRRYPDGLDAEAFDREVLEAAWLEAPEGPDREHVTPWIYRHPERFMLGSVRCPEDLSRLRWTVDEPRDLEFVREVYARLYPDNPAFGMSDILELLAGDPAVGLINASVSMSDGEAHE